MADFSGEQFGNDCFRKITGGMYMNKGNLRKP